MSSQWAIGQQRSRCGCEYMGGYGIENDGGFRNGNGGGYKKIKRNSGFRSGNNGGDGKWSRYCSRNGFGVESGSEQSGGGDVPRM